MSVAAPLAKYDCGDACRLTKFVTLLMDFWCAEHPDVRTPTHQQPDGFMLSQAKKNVLYHTMKKFCTDCSQLKKKEAKGISGAGIH